MTKPACSLCDTDGGRLVLRTPQFRLIHAQEAGFPGFYRLVWNAHVAEFSDLPPADRSLCMAAVAVVERLMREYLAPDKINLAALGNVVAHLHWHLIARYEWDTHFPAPVWAAAVRQPDAAQIAAIEARLPALEHALRERIGADGTIASS